MLGAGGGEALCRPRRPLCVWVWGRGHGTAAKARLLCVHGYAPFATVLPSARLPAPADFGVEKAVSVQGATPAAVLTSLESLIKAGEALPK